MLTLTSKAYDGRYLEVTCQQIPNVEENTSEIRWTLSVRGGESSYYSTGPTTVTIAGQQVYYCKRKSYSTKVFPAAKGSISGSLTVAHNDDGSLTVPVSLTTAIFDSKPLDTVSEDWQLDTIARASLIRAADAYIGSCATVVVTRRSEAFSHEIAWEFGGLSGWLDAAGETVAQPVRFGATTLNFLLPESFYEEIPDEPRGSCLLRCVTYYGDEKIGEESCSFWANADPAACSPLAEGMVEVWDELTKSLAGSALIPGISTALCRVTARAQKGARLVSVTAGGVAVVEQQALLPGWSLDTVPVVVTDSRGKLSALTLDVEGIRGTVSQQEGLSQRLTTLEQSAQGLRLSVESIQTQGATRLKTAMGYTFDDEGLSIARSGEPMENRLDNTGMQVLRSGTPILQADHRGVNATDVTVRNYLILGDHARIENYAGSRTACFYLEG